MTAVAIINETENSKRFLLAGRRISIGGCGDVTLHDEQAAAAIEHRDWLFSEHRCRVVEPGQIFSVMLQNTTDRPVPTPAGVLFAGVKRSFYKRSEIARIGSQIAALQAAGIKARINRFKGEAA